MKEIPLRFVSTLSRMVFTCIVVALAACAQLPEGDAPLTEDQKNELAFPPPPDDAHFFWERTLRGSADVLVEDSTAEFKRSLTGLARVGEGMVKPYSVAVYRGRVFVSDTGAHNIRVFDIPARRYFVIGEEGAAELRMPLGIDTDRHGNLYVCDGSLKVVKVFDKDGKFLRQLGGLEWFSKPASVAVDPNGERVYVVDIGGTSSDEHRIRVFDAHSGQHLLDIGKRGVEDGEFNLPKDATVAKDGTLYVSDAGNFRVQAFSPDGKFLRKFGSIGLRSGQFSRPKEIATDSAGNVYVIDSSFGNAQLFNPQGQLLMALGVRSARDIAGRYMLPSGVAVDEDDRVYVVDQVYRKVDVFRPANMKPEDGFGVLGKTILPPKK